MSAAADLVERAWSLRHHAERLQGILAPAASLLGADVWRGAAALQFETELASTIRALGSVASSVALEAARLDRLAVELDSAG